MVAARRARDDGEAHLARGDLVAAERSFGDVLSQLRNGVMGNPASAVVAAAAHIGLGRVLLGRHDPVVAAEEFDSAQRLQPDSWRGYYWAGCAAAHHGDHAGADRSFTEALRRAPGLSRAFVQRAYVRLRQDPTGDPAGGAALADLESAARFGALDDDAALVMAALQLRRGRWAQALRSLRDVQAQTRAPVVAVVRGFALEQQGEHLAALAEYQRATACADAGAGALFHHGRLALRLGRFEDGLRCWTRLRHRYPQRAPSEPPGALDAALAGLHLHAAARAASRPEPDGLQQARGHVAAARALRGDDQPVLHYVALLEFLSGAHRSAEELWAELNRARPEDTRSRHGLAMCAVQRGELDQAEHDLVALSAAATDPVARRAARGVVALAVRRGRWQRAVELLRSRRGDDRYRDALLPECLYRSGAATDRQGPRGGLWHAAGCARAGDPDAALELLGRLEPRRQGEGATGRDRRELGLLLRAAALAHAQASRWESAAELLSTSRDLIGERPGFALQDGAVCLLGGGRGVAIEILTEGSRHNPADHRITHALAVVALHSLSADAPVTASWPDCIAAWVAILADPAFWEHWRRTAERRYRTPVTPSDVQQAREGVRALLQDRLAAAGDPGDAHSSPYGPLFQREIEAARVLDRLGGFPVPGMAARPLVCGPLRITQLGLHTAFGAFASRIGSQRGGAPQEPTAVDDVSRCFSQLGVAHGELLAGRPAAALAALADLRCPHCSAKECAAKECAAKETDGRGSSVAGPAMCATDCTWFEAYNPAYAALEDNRHRLARDAAVLAVEALLRLGRDAVVAGDMNLAQAAIHWREAISRGTELGERREVQCRVVDLALGRAETLARRQAGDEAIAVLDAAREVTEPSVWQRIDGPLAGLLTSRGVARANEGPGRLAEAVDDLCRAVALNQHLVRARVNLCIALRRSAAQRSERDDRDVAIMLLREAIARCTTGLALTTGHRGLSEQRDKAAAELTALLEGRW